MAKKNSVPNAQTLFRGVQFNGSLAEGEGIGRYSVRPSEAMRKTLPGRMEETRPKESSEEFVDSMIYFCVWGKDQL